MGDEGWQLSKDSAGAATATVRHVEKGTTKNGIKTATERSRIPYKTGRFAHKMKRAASEIKKGEKP
jgi:hypothetical protein